MKNLYLQQYADVKCLSILCNFYYIHKDKMLLFPLGLVPHYYKFISLWASMTTADYT